MGVREVCSGNMIPAIILTVALIFWAMGNT